MTSAPSFVAKPGTHQPGRSVLSYVGWTGVGLAIIALLFVSSGLTIQTLALIAVSVPIWVYAALAALQVLILILASTKWCIILDQFATDGKTLPLKDALAGTTLGALFGQLLPIQIVTPLARAWVARLHQISAARAVGTSVFEQVFEVAVLVTMGLVSVLLFLTDFGIVSTLAIASIAGLGVVGFIGPMFRALRTLVLWMVERVSTRLSALGNTLADALLRSSAFPKPVLLRLTALSGHLCKGHSGILPQSLILESDEYKVIRCSCSIVEVFPIHGVGFHFSDYLFSDRWIL